MTAQVASAPSVDYLERAFDDAKYGGFSRRPYMDIVVPTIQDTTLAPPGKHIVSILGGHAAYRLTGQSWAEVREDLFAAVIDTISEYAPGFGNSIIYKQILTPIDLESIFALPGGHVHHGDLGIDQIFFKRPAPHYANYLSPVAGLYQWAPPRTRGRRERRARPQRRPRHPQGSTALAGC